MKKRSAVECRSIDEPLPAQIATDRIKISSTCRPWGIATGKPFGLPTPRAIRSMMRVRGWGLSNLTRRPMPAFSKPVYYVSEDGRGKDIPSMAATHLRHLRRVL